MRKLVLAAIVIVVLSALALPSSAMPKGTLVYGDYTIVVMPYSAAHPGHGGSITITCNTDTAVVELTGEYLTTTRPKPVLSVHLEGYVGPPDEPAYVEWSYTFLPRETHNVWRTVIAWIESELAR